MGEQPRSYLVVPPHDYDPSHAYPMVLGLHGSGANGRQFRAHLDLEGRTREGALFAYPDGIRVGEGSGWILDGKGRDVRFIDELVTDVAARYCVDESRVFAVGFSYGGWLANTLGCTRPNRFSAIVSIAGGGPRDACTGSTAAMIVHGSSDFDEPLTSGEASRDHWFAANRCGKGVEPMQEPGCVRYLECGAHPVAFCRHPGGHEIPAFARGLAWRFFLGAGKH